MPQRASRTTNHILSELSSKDRALLEPDLEAVDLPVRFPIAGRNRRIEYVYFLDEGMASVVADGGKPIEVGIIGREGFAGLAVLLGNDRSHNEIFVQIAGKGRRIRSEIFREADEQSLTLHRSLMRFVHSFLMQVSETATANGRCKAEERLARWLLLAQDRVASDEIPLTHEFLGIMLGTARPGVTLAVQTLQSEKLIDGRRGKLLILNRDGLLERCNGSYRPLDS
jgi:CRP-like cAMP-binding protein